MTLGIVAAMPVEMRTITRQRVSVGSVVPHTDNVLLALSGIGPQRAHAAGKLLLNHGVTALLSWGTAAALDSRLASGSLILPNTIIAANGAIFSVNPEWHERLRQQLSTRFEIYTGAIVESPTVLSNSNDKRSLLEHSGGIAADMESAALAAVAQAADIPFLVIRTIVDSAAMSIPQRLMRAIDSTGRINNIRPLAGLIVHPEEWLAVARLARGFHRARATLENVVKYTNGSLQ